MSVLYTRSGVVRWGGRGVEWGVLYGGDVRRDGGDVRDGGGYART